MKGETMLAIQKYQQAARATHRLERADHELNQAVERIPEEDMAEYVKATSEIEAIQRQRCKICRDDVADLKRAVVADLELEA